MKSQGAAPSTTGPWIAGPWIVGPWIDSLFFLFTPLIPYALGALAWLAGLRLGEESEFGLADLGGIFVSAHLVAVFFRSHANREIRTLHPVRFFAVPVVLFGAMWFSLTVLVAVSVLATWWDVYHSSLQTFGLGRIYDRKAGNDPRIGRRLDMGLNWIIYIGPILGGASLMEHVDSFQEFSQVGSLFLSSIPAHARSHAGDLMRGVLVASIAYALFYLWSYARLIRAGYRVSMQKAVLLAVTALVSVAAWGFNSFGEAFFVMNFFHAFQYYAIVWFYERRTIQRVFRLEKLGRGETLGLALFLVLIFAYGTALQYFEVSNRFWEVLGLTVAILHFWYDGFIWSVRKHQV